MPEERFTWRKQRRERGGELQPRYGAPSWFPVSPRYKAGYIPEEAWQPAPSATTTRPTSYAYQLMAEQEQARRAAKFVGEEPTGKFDLPEYYERTNLENQIAWYQDRMNLPLTPFEKDISIEALRGTLENLKQSYATKTGGGGQIPWLSQKAMESQQQLAQIQKREQQTLIESRALAKEFPEWLAMMGGGGRRALPTQEGGIGDIYTAFAQERAARGWGGASITGQEQKTRAAWSRATGGGGPKHRPEDMFGTWFKGQHEELIQQWKAEKMREFPTLYPWFEEAGGWQTGKSFQEWMKGEPLAQAFLSEKREAEAMRRPPQIRRRWQPARQR